MTEHEPTRAPAWSRGVRAYVGLVAVLGAIGLVGSGVFVGPPREWVPVATLLVLGLLSVLVREPDVGSKVTFSFLSIIMIASIVLAGPVGCGLIGAVSISLERGHRPTVARLFNAGMTAVQGVVGGLVYLAVGGAQDLKNVEGPGELLLLVGLPLMVADVAQMLVNAILLAGVVRLSSGVPPRRFLVHIVTNSGVAYIGYGVIGFLFVVLWVPADVGPFSALLILAPLSIARWAFVQYGDEQRAHERALSALVTAVETKDPHAAGHSSRIALLAEWMAEPLSMGAQEVQSLRFAAMLHDVGKVGVPTRLLRRPRSLTSADLDALTRHPEHGVTLVEDIGFLADSLDGIRHHHERWDGLGYPDGLAGEAIPLASRVIAVADAFDALTTTRPERRALIPSQALKQVEQRRGSQFDPAVVAALATVLDRHDWAEHRSGQPGEESEDESSEAGRFEAMRGYVDHDDPVTWERVWVARSAAPTVAHPAAPAPDAAPARSTTGPPPAADEPTPTRVTSP